MAGTPVKSGGPVRVEWEEVQRFALRGYPKLDVTRFVFLRVVDQRKACGYVERLLRDGWLKFGWGERHHTRRRAVLRPVASIAFTADGLRALGMDAATLHGFAPEFVEGMDAPARARVLRDEGNSAPDRWIWGGPGNRVHIVLVIHAPTHDALVGAIAEHRARREGAGVEEVFAASDEPLGECQGLDERKEHFGFADGIAQPRFRDEPEGVRKKSSKSREADRIATGEILLGYENEANLLPRSPLVPEAHAPLLGGAHRDFGRNGTYVVFRQLEQDVGAFWRTMAKAAPSATVADRVRLASKMVGRWPDGAPLVPSQPGQDPEDFDFARDDAQGLHCPLGAHIRRANPRATLARDPEMGVMKSKKHRLLRRGRSYGTPFVDPLEPEALIRAAEEGTGRPGPRGLHFLCLNADIANQFEFVQQTWVNGPIFAGLHGEVDPLIGDPAVAGRGFTVPGCPVRSRVHDLPRFVEVRGGAYFFLPSRTAVAYLGKLASA
jgi:Dyp-type peroxidase family